MIAVLEYLALGLLPAFLLLDLAYGYRRAPRSRRWRLRATVVSTLTVIWSVAVAGFWGNLSGEAHLLDLSALGMVGGALVATLVYEFFHYWYHRAAHRYDWLWRLGHQMHHSAETLDPFGAYYMHPIDAAIFTTLQSLVFFPLLGVGLEAGLLAAAFLSFNAVFQHADWRTPRWLGYVIQRPESHLLHHQRGVHAYNYSDLPVLDLLFGTFRNPPGGYDARTGFRDGASVRLAELLTFRVLETSYGEDGASRSA